MENLKTTLFIVNGYKTIHRIIKAFRVNALMSFHLTHNYESFYLKPEPKSKGFYFSAFQSKEIAKHQAN